MKILVVGSKKEWAIENHYVKHLRSFGVDIECYYAHDIFYEYFYKSMLNKALFRGGFSKIYEIINTDLIKIVEENHYDIVWIFKGMEIFPRTLEILKSKGAYLTNFNPDHPFLYNFKGSGNKNVLNSIGLYDLHLCYNLMIKSKIEKEFNIRSIWLPFGYEETTVDLPEEKDEILRACFIGNPDKFRADLIMGLAENGVPLTLFGNNWDKWISLQKTADIHYHPAIYKNDFNETATRYRVQLNSFRPHNENSHNMRTFEMPGLGCIMVAPKSDEHEILFKDGKEVLLYKNKVELVTQTLKILNLDYESAMQLRHSALTRSMNSGYSYKARTKKLLGIFETVLNER